MVCRLPTEPVRSVPGAGIEPAASTFRAWRHYQQQLPRNLPNTVFSKTVCQFHGFYESRGLGRLPPKTPVLVTGLVTLSIRYACLRPTKKPGVLTPGLEAPRGIRGPGVNSDVDRADSPSGWQVARYPASVPNTGRSFLSPDRQGRQRVVHLIDAGGG